MMDWSNDKKQNDTGQVLEQKLDIQGNEQFVYKNVLIDLTRQTNLHKTLDFRVQTQVSGNNDDGRHNVPRSNLRKRSPFPCIFFLKALIHNI